MAEWRMGESRGRVEFSAPGSGRHLGHAAEQSFLRPAPQQDEAIGAYRHERRSAAQRAGLLRGLARKHRLIAAHARRTIAIPGAERASRILRRADGGAEIHQALDEIAGPPR